MCPFDGFLSGFGVLTGMALLDWCRKVNVNPFNNPTAYHLPSSLGHISDKDLSIFEEEHSGEVTILANQIKQKLKILECTKVQYPYEDPDCFLDT